MCTYMGSLCACLNVLIPTIWYWKVCGRTKQAVIWKQLWWVLVWQTLSSTLPVLVELECTCAGCASCVLSVFLLIYSEDSFLSQFHCKLNLVSCCTVFKNNSSVMSYYFPLNMLFKIVNFYLSWGLKCHTHCKDIQLYSGCLLKEHLPVLLVTIWFSVLIFVWFLIGCRNRIIIPVFMYNLAIDRWFQLPDFFVIVLDNLFHKICDC